MKEREGTPYLFDHGSDATCAHPYSCCLHPSRPWIHYCNAAAPGCLVRELLPNFRSPEPEHGSTACTVLLLSGGLVAPQQLVPHASMRPCPLLMFCLPRPSAIRATASWMQPWVVPVSPVPRWTQAGKPTPSLALPACQTQSRDSWSLCCNITGKVLAQQWVFLMVF